MQLFANNAFSTLAAAIAVGDTSLSVQPGQGAKFPAPTGGDYFLITLFQLIGGVEANHEVVKVTARSVDTFTIVRGQESTTARAWGVGDQVSHRGTAGTLGALAQLGAAGQAFTQPVSVPTATTGTNTTQAASTAFVTAAVQQVKADLVANSPAALDTLNELATALGNDANFSTTVTTALGNRVRVDVNTQGLSAQQKANAATNMGLATVATTGAKADIGLGNVDNTSDVNKPVSNATQTALALKADAATSAPLASPTFTGAPKAPTPSAGTTSTQLATAGFVASEKEYLTALAQSFHQGAVVDAFLYDTSRDSDGGAWRKRCQHTSWENEAKVPGKWLGQLANFTEAWVAQGGSSGDYFQSSGGQFYQLTTSQAGGVEVFRGNTRQFPALALIVVETGRVAIYDATQPSLPMWMVFTASTAAFPSVSILGRNVVTHSSVTAINGEVFIGANVSASECLVRVSFIKDSARGHSTVANSYIWPGVISQRNSALSVTITGASDANIVNAVVNDVAATVLPDAPIDLATGLPVPTIAVATAGGVSVLRHDGTVVNSSDIAGASSVCVTGDVLAWANSSGGQIHYARSVGSLGTGFNNAAYTVISVPAVVGGTTGVTVGSNKLMAQSALGVSLLKENPATPVKGMAAFITNAYSSGWQVGDSRGAWLADTVAETATGVELVTNGTFTTDTSGWLAGNGATLSMVSGAMRVTNSAAANYGYAYQAIATVNGKTYTATLSYTKGTLATTSNLRASNTGGGAQELGNIAMTASGVYSLTFVATSATTYISVLQNNETSVYSDYDNISVKLADPDRSVKAKGLAINGSITKAPVAAGAQLVGYSGFSAANYLEQPYNSDLDFGTGDFCVMGWVKSTDATAYVLTTESATANASKYALRWTFENSSVRAGVFAHTGNNSIVTIATPYSAGALVHVALLRRSGTLYFYVNGVQSGTAASGQDIGQGVLRVGEGRVNSFPLINGSIALLRTSATAPSDDQIAQIYRDELPLFQPGAQATIDGTSAAVTALAYDDTTDLLHVGTSWGRSAFHGLQRVESSATTVGAVTTIAAACGAHITAGATAARYVQPTMLLRDELRRRYEVRRAMTREEIPIDFDGIAAQTAFTLPLGFTTKGVFVAGTKKRAGSTKDYTTSFDGYRETVNFGASPGAAWVQITANRSL